MTVSCLNAVIVADQDHIAVSASDAHLFDDAVAGRVDLMRVAGRKVDAVMMSRTIMAKSETGGKARPPDRRARKRHAGDPRQGLEIDDMPSVVRRGRIVDMIAIAEMEHCCEGVGTCWLGWKLRLRRRRCCTGGKQACGEESNYRRGNTHSKD